MNEVKEPKTVKVKFTRTANYKSVNPKGHLPGQLSYITKIFEEGKTYELPEDQAARFVRRGAAEETNPKATAPQPVAIEDEDGVNKARATIAQGAHLKTASKP